MPGRHNMMVSLRLFVFFMAGLIFISADFAVGHQRAEIISCRGCSLMKMSKLRHVLEHEIHDYDENISVTWKPSEKPRVVFYDDKDMQQGDRHDLGDWDKRQLFEFFNSHGFHPQGHEFPPQDLPMEVFERHFDFEDHHYIAYFVAGVKKKTYKNYLRTLEYNGKKDGYFLVIESEAENNFLTEYMQKHKIAGFWLGATDTGREGIWRWNGGPHNGKQFDEYRKHRALKKAAARGETPFSLDFYTNWADNEPSDSGRKEDCAVVIGETGLWNDVDCETKGFFFVAEFGKRYQQSATAWPVVKPEHAARVNREHAEKRKNKSPAHDEL